MALFLSTYVNKLDAKGRISVPASFRTSLSTQSFQGVVLFKSQNHPALEGFPMSFMEEISKRLDRFDLFSAEQDDLATTVFGESVQLPLDGDGRIVMPQGLMDYASLNGHAAFVGMGHKFQIWSPEALEARKDSAKKQVQAKGLTIPNTERGEK